MCTARHLHTHMLRQAASRQLCMHVCRVITANAGACNNIRCVIQSSARTAGQLISHCLLDGLDALPSMPSSHAIKQACVS